MKSSFRLLACLLLIAFTVLAVGCGSMPTPAQQAVQIEGAQKVVDTLKDVSTQLGTMSADMKSLKQSSTTMPSASPDVAKAVDKITASTDQAKQYVDVVTHVVDTFAQSMKDQQASQTDALSQMAVLAKSAHDVTHDIAPGTKADDTTALVAIGVLGLAKIISSITSKSVMKTAITTPGTTPPIAASSGTS